MKVDLRETIISALEKRNYKTTTIQSYSSQLFKLFDYYSSIPPLEITNKQVSKYAQSLINQKKSRSTVKTLIYACNFYYDELNNKKHGVYKFKLPPEKPKRVEFFKQSEILEIIETKDNIKHKSIILLMYSCGLEIGELLNLKVDSIRSKEKRPNVQVYDNNGKIKRKAFLSKRILPTLRKYYSVFEPTNWLFYSQNDKNKQYSSNTIRSMINTSIKELNLNPLLNSKSIRHSYIKHLNELGIPLIKILGSLSIESFDTHLKYSKLVHGTDEIYFTPLDKRLNEDSEVEDFKDLEHLVFELEDKNEIDYLIEALDCFRCGALRAGVIFIWSASIKRIRQKIIDSTKLIDINRELQIIEPKAKKIKNIESFEFIKDETTLHLSQKVGLYDKFEKNELINSCLGLRNKCGHPSNYKPEIQKVKAFVEDILNLVYKKQLLNIN